MADDFCHVFSVSAGLIILCKANDLETVFAGGSVNDLPGFAFAIGSIGIGYRLLLFLAFF